MLMYAYEYAKMLNELVKAESECRFITKMNVFSG